MSDDLRERVARAIFATIQIDNGFNIENLPEVADAALAEMGGVRWHSVEQRLPPVGMPVLVANLRDGVWCVRSACLFVRHEGVFPMPERVADRPTDFWFDAPRGQNDMRLVRPGMMWAETPSPDAAIDPAPVSVREAGERDDSTPVDVSDKTKTTYFDSVPAIEAEMKLHKGRE